MKKKLQFLFSVVTLMFVAVAANAQFADGKYYLQNVESGRYWGAGNSWGTQASLVANPEYVTLVSNDDGTYKMNSQVTNSFGENGFMDNGTPYPLTITQSGDYYTVSGSLGYCGYDGTSTVLKMDLEEDSKNALWKIFSEAEMIASLANATVENPVDATFLVLDHNFGRQNSNYGAWTKTNVSNKGGNNENQNVETYHNTFSMSQTIENAPKGVYALTAQGFYRQDGADNDNLPYIYINDGKSTFPLKTGTENSMSDASVSFSAGLYVMNPAYTALSEAGTLEIGAKLEENKTLWCIWDNFVLMYYGPDATVEEAKFQNLAKQVSELCAQATELMGNENVSAGTVKALGDAISAFEDIEYTEEACLAAIANLNAAINQANKDITNKPLIDALYALAENTNVYTAEGYATYKAWVDGYKEAFDAGTLTETVVNPSAITGWHAGNSTIGNFLLSAWTIGGVQAKDFDTALYINTWSTEGENDGSNFRVPFFEYWTGDGESLKANAIEATLTDLPVGTYDISAWVRVRAKNGTAAADATGITLSANGGEAVDVTEGEVVGDSQFSLAEYKAEGVVGEDGKLVIKLNVAEDNNISWLSFKNVKATKQIIYIETDVTAQFPTDWQGWQGATGFTSNTFAPNVDTNDGRNVQVCERFDGGNAAEGTVFTRTLTGLTNGIYRIELYGAAASTKGRDTGINSDMTAENEGDTDAVYLYAKTADGMVKQYIPVHWATSFNEIATAVLEGVEISDETVEIGMYSEKKYTNWHVVQIKGVTALVNADDYLAAAIAKAKDIDADELPAILNAEIASTIAAYDKSYMTAEEYIEAVEAINAIVAKASEYPALTAVLKEGEAIKANVAEGNSAIEAYDAAIADVKAAYEAAEVEDMAAAIATVEAALPAIAKAQTAPNSDMTRAIVNPQINGATGWTTDKPNGGNGPLLDGNKFEYWNGSAANGAFDYYQIIEGLPSGKYVLSAEMYNSTNGEGGAEFAPTSGLYASEKETVTAPVDVDGTELLPYSLEITIASNSLRIGVKNFETMAARWFVADNFKLTLVEAITSYAIEVAEAENGVVTTDAANAFEGDVVSITAEPAEGYELAEVTVTGASGASVEVEIDEWTGAISFTMPAEDVTVSATFQEAYVKLSNYELACDGEFDEDGDVTVVVTYDAELVGSYAESFMLDAVFTYEVSDAEGNVVASGEKNPFEVSAGTLNIYISNLQPQAEYTITITNVVVTDLDLTTFETVTVYLEEGALPSLTFTTGVPTSIANVEAAPAVKADGKYLENGQIVIYRGGIKYNAAGAVIR